MQSTFWEIRNTKHLHDVVWVLKCVCVCVCSVSEYFICQNLKFAHGHHIFPLQPYTSKYLRFCCWKTLFSVNNTVINSCKKENNRAPLIDTTHTHTHKLPLLTSSQSISCISVASFYSIGSTVFSLLCLLNVFQFFICGHTHSTYYV